VHYLVKPFRFEDLAARLEAFRRAHRALAGSAAPDQASIDEVFAPVAGTPREQLPKGLSPETADAVLAALTAAEEDLSATECAELVGVSRVSARRYLEHYVATGRARVRLQYGGSGRPERRYRLTRSP
jgi:response regulator of citrate/malate metabolism